MGRVLGGVGLTLFVATSLALVLAPPEWLIYLLPFDVVALVLLAQGFRMLRFPPFKGEMLL